MGCQLMRPCSLWRPFADLRHRNANPGDEQATELVWTQAEKRGGCGGDLSERTMTCARGSRSARLCGQPMAVDEGLFSSSTSRLRPSSPSLRS